MFSEAVWEPPFSWGDECVLAALFQVFDDCARDHSGLADTLLSGNGFEIHAHLDRCFEAQIQTLWRSVLEFMIRELLGVHGCHKAVKPSNNSG